MKAEERAWFERRAAAAEALAAQRASELGQLSDERALAMSDTLLSLVDPARLDRARRVTTGLVEQQALFHRRPT